MSYSRDKLPNTRHPVISRGAKGFTLVEVCAAIVILSLLTVALLQTAMVRVASRELLTDKQDARQAADAGLEALASVSRQALPDGVGSFTLQADNTLSLTNPCSPQTCDFVLEPEAPLVLRTSLAKGIPWSSGYSPPSGSRVKFFRRWRTQGIPPPDGNPGPTSRELTLVALVNERATLPLTLAQTVVTPR